MSSVLLTALLWAVRGRAVAKPAFVPQPAHVFMVILENEDVAAPQQPFLGELASGGALLTNYHCLTHPSQPNYIALTAGSAYGIQDDTPVTIDVRNVADLIEQRGLTWKVYAEDYPGNCFLGSSAANGLYVRKHIPFIEFSDIQNDARRCANIVDASELDADIAAGTLPSFAFYVPNDQHNGHDTSLAVADQFLETRFEPLIQNPAFINNLVFIVTFDESNSLTNSQVSTILYGDSVKRGVQSATYYDHYSLLKTIEEMLGVGFLDKHDVTADSIAGIWK